MGPYVVFEPDPIILDIEQIESNEFDLVLSCWAGDIYLNTVKNEMQNGGIQFFYPGRSLEPYLWFLENHKDDFRYDIISKDGTGYCRLTLSDRDATLFKLFWL